MGVNTLLAVQSCQVQSTTCTSVSSSNVNDKKGEGCFILVPLDSVTTKSQYSVAQHKRRRFLTHVIAQGGWMVLVSGWCFSMQ